LTLGGTVAGIAALVAVKYQPAPSTAALAGTIAPPTRGAMLVQGTPATPSGAGGAAGTGTKAPSGGAKPHATAKPSATVTPKPSGTRQSTATRVSTGAVESTRYGPMQVQVTLAGTRITKVTVLQETNVGGTSSQIDAMAIPKLTAEALAAQSAKIDAVSGASYTSAGYIQSLQSALDKAGA